MAVKPAGGEQEAAASRKRIKKKEEGAENIRGIFDLVKPPFGEAKEKSIPMPKESRDSGPGLSSIFNHTQSYGLLMDSVKY